LTYERGSWRKRRIFRPKRGSKRRTILEIRGRKRRRG
jgi:hypothetical protein